MSAKRKPLERDRLMLRTRANRVMANTHWHQCKRFEVAAFMAAIEPDYKRQKELLAAVECHCPSCQR